MNWIDSMVPWEVPKHGKWFDYFRILFGAFIVYKGLIFIIDIDGLYDSIGTLSNAFIIYTEGTLIQNISEPIELSEITNDILATFLSIYITGAHLFGGTLLVLGLFTRWICLIQIPILLGAIFLVNLHEGFLSIAGSVELVVSVIVLFGLVFYSVFGAGVNSIDELRRRDKRQMEGQTI